MKKRAPIEQLRAAGSVARKMLIERGIHTKESAIDGILKENKSPMLPGIPPYLPHEWTIKAAQRIMRDLVIIWKEKTEKKPEKQNDITEFWKFCVSELRKQEKEFRKEKRMMAKKVKEYEKKVSKVPVLKDIFSPMRKEENVRAIQHFLVDSFAVSVSLKNAETTSDYLNWFLDWTQDLYLFWIRPQKRKEVKRV